MSQHVSSRAVSVVLAAVFLSAAVSADHRDRLLYQPAVLYQTGQPGPGQTLDPDFILPDQVTYVTAAGFTRRVPIAVWLPHGAPEPLPVVIWAHGKGARSGDNPAGSMTAWAMTGARAGYLSIAVTHVANTPLEQLQMCQAIGYPIPQNPAAIATAVQDLANQMAGSGTVDVSAIVAQFPEIFASVVPDPAEGSAARVVLDRLLDYVDGCRSINNLGLWDRPRDIQAVMDALVSIPELQGRIDPDRIAVAGHSNGSNSALQAAGLVRTLPNGVPVPVPSGVIRPIAAIGLSPMGPNEFGLFDTSTFNEVIDPKAHSWDGLDLPVLTATGDGDESCNPHRYVCGGGDTGSTRRIPFERMPPRHKYLLYIADRRAPTIVSMHTMFGEADQCLPGADAACAETRQWVESTVVAFLDAYVRERASARAWLMTDRVERASHGIAELSRK
jgi:acetyl esterase/lipase